MPSLGQDGQPQGGSRTWRLPELKALGPKLCFFAICLVVIQSIEPTVSSILGLEKVIDQAAYGWLADHARAPKPEEIKVALLDISEVQEIDSDVQPGERVSDPVALSEIVDRLGAAGATVVAIDIDMGSTTGVPRHSKQVSNLDSWLELTESKAGPSVVVGVYEATSLGADNWDKMKASLAIEDMKGRAVDEIRSPVWDVPLTGMARKVVQELQRRSSGQIAPRSAPLRGVFSPFFDADEAKEGSITLRNRYIHPTLVPYFTKHYLTTSELEANQSAVRGKAVILGDVAPGTFRDSFRFPSEERVVPGAAIHAAAAQSMLSPPVVKLNRWGGLVLSLMVGIAMVFIKEMVTLRFGEKVIREEAFELVAALCLFLLTMGMADALLDWGGILWYGYFLSPLSLPLGYVLAKAIEFAARQAMGGKPA